jgi:hypothetical protein
VNNRTTFIAALLLLIVSPIAAQLAITNKNHSSSLSIADSTGHKKKIINNRWQPYIGLHVSGDAGMYYIGPSFQAGTDFYLKKKLLLSAYFHYFRDELHTSDVNGFFEDGKYRTMTGALLIQTNTAKKRTDKSFFLAAGISIQNRVDTANTSYDHWNDRRTTLTPAMRLGYFFPVRKRRLSVELNATGPYRYGDETSSVLEILTQLSFGCRFIF